MRLARVEKWDRLRSMSADELVYRIREKMRVEADRISSHWKLDAAQNTNLRFCFDSLTAADLRKRLSIEGQHFSFKRYLQQGPSHRFYLPAKLREREILKQFINSYFPEWKREAAEEANSLCEHRVEILGYGERHLGSDIDWHRDPVTGRVWSRRFWGDYDLVNEFEGGDPKCVHELNRHQHLPRLAKAYFLTGDEAFAREAVGQMLSWIEQNPPEIGIHWASSLEMGIRAISWLWTIFFLLDSEVLDDEAARLICASLFAQLEHIYRYPSVFSSPNTHLLGEAAALFIGGVVFPEHKHARHWRDWSASVLAEQMEKQVSKDGIHGELSSYYHCYTLDFYLQTLILADQNRFFFPSFVWKKLTCMIDFLMHLSRPDGSIPLLGDDDGGRALALKRTCYDGFTDALCTGGVLFRRADLKHGARAFHEETLWFIGNTAWHIYWGLPYTSPSTTSFSPEKGYFIQRSGWDESASHLVFDCGGMGIITGGHGHADMLSLSLFSGGKELLVDPGTYNYNDSPEWRNFFRSTRAHNTAIVDELDQSEAGEKFRWNHTAQPRLVKQHTYEDVEYVESEHDGYTRLQQPVIHRRRLLHCKSGYWALLDDFRGEGEHKFDLLYNFGPGVTVLSDGCKGSHGQRDFIARAPGAGLLLSVSASVPFRTEIVSGQQSPRIQGWVSDRYGRKTPALALQTSFRSAVPVASLGLLLPNHSENSREWKITGLNFSAAQHGSFGCIVKRFDHEDYIIASVDNSEIEILGCQMRGEFFWLRTTIGSLIQIFAAGVRSFRYQGQELLSDSQQRNWLCARIDNEGRIIEQHEAGDTTHVWDMRDRELQQR